MTFVDRLARTGGLIALGALGAIGATHFTAPDGGPPGAGPAMAWATVEQSEHLADVSERALRSVVYITTTRPPEIVRTPFGFGPMDARPSIGQGSGVIVGDGTTVLTNHHVVAGASEVTVRLSDGTELEAELVGSDPATDLAALRLDPAGLDLTPIEFGDADQLRPGELVLAIGSPFGLSGSVSMGIVSATGRHHMGITDYEDFIQTDAAINPGNSGGALVDMHGRLVGINTAIHSRSGGNNGIGFAIPATMVETVLPALLAEGRVSRGWLGVGIDDVSGLGDKLDIDRAVRVRQVLPDGPAARSGLRVGDLIATWDGEPLVDADDLRNRVAAAGADVDVRLGVLRGGDPLDLEVSLGERPDPPTR